jgi:hypothetical protein
MTSATPIKQRRYRVLARNLTLAAVAAALVAGVVPSAAGAAPKPAASVCNEAENSWQGGYAVTGGPVDPNPPAFLRGSQMRVGNGHGAGLEHAAERSPALRLCGPEGGDGGGDDDGGIILI